MTGDFLPFASRGYCCMLALLVFARGMDFFSTWVATPNLVLEGNPLAKKTGLETRRAGQPDPVRRLRVLAADRDYHHHRRLAGGGAQFPFGLADARDGRGSLPANGFWNKFRGRGSRSISFACWARLF